MAPTWVAMVKAAVQPIAGALPALILVLFAGLLGLLALACGEARRQYALEYAEKITGLAAVVVGMPPKARRATPARRTAVSRAGGGGGRGPGV
jgi:hypothetical protein